MYSFSRVVRRCTPKNLLRNGNERNDRRTSYLAVTPKRHRAWTSDHYRSSEWIVRDFQECWRTGMRNLCKMERWVVELAEGLRIPLQLLCHISLHNSRLRTH